MHKLILLKKASATLACLSLLLMLTGCPKSVPTPEADKIPDFQEQISTISMDLEENNLSLYVDYSICMITGVRTQLFRALLPSFTTAMSYYSIKGDTIQKEDGDVYRLFSTITEVSYANLEQAANMIADGKGEAILMTDGEYFQQGATGGNCDNPYMAGALKKWLLRGHDIHILIEPFVEQRKGHSFNKKRYYFIFTDNRLKGNIYSRIVNTASLGRFDNVEQFHLSADHPSILANGSHSTVNDLLSATVESKGFYEIQDWQTDWKAIEKLLLNTVDEETGQQLPNGNYILKGLKVDRSSLGAYEIKNITANVYVINDIYTDFYDHMEQTPKAPFNFKQYLPMEPVQNFIVLDQKEFNTHGMVQLFFDKNMYDPSCLTGNPYNYLKIDLCVSEIGTIFDRYEHLFTFDCIDAACQQNGKLNVSLRESIKQCMDDPDVKAKVMQAPIYTIYIKTFKH